jgi:hypothetical protein
MSQLVVCHCAGDEIAKALAAILKSDKNASEEEADEALVPITNE